MTATWIAPLAVSAAVGLVATPPIRRLALSVGLVDRPAPHKPHRRVTANLGGIAIAIAVIAGRLVGSDDGLSATLTGLAAVLALTGLVDDDRQLSWLSRLVVETGCAVAALLVGLRITGTGVPDLDVVVTIVLLVGVTNATNLMDNLDGLAAGVTAVGAAGAGVLGVVAGNATTAAGAASLVGACLAFLVFNSRPASIFMGDAGSLFLGFLLTAVAIKAGASFPEPATLVIPLLILALPITDTTTVVVCRLRHGRSPLVGGRDHLSHRLAGTGLGPGRAVAVLIGIEVLLAGLADLAGGGIVPLWSAVVVAVVILSGVVAVAVRVRVYRYDAVGLPRVVAWGFPLALAIVAALAGPAAVGLWRADDPARAGETMAEQGLAAARSGHLQGALTDLAAARGDFARADADLHAPLTSAGLAYPVLSTNLQAGRTLVGGGLSIARLADRLDEAVNGRLVQAQGGTVAVHALARAAPGLTEAAASLQRSATEVRRLPATYLLAPVADAVRQLRGVLGPAEREVAAAASLATHLPPLLGADGPRRYFVAVQNPTESRATGGLIGNWAVLVADQGHVRLTGFGRLGALDRGGNPVRVLHAPADYLARYEPFDPAQLWQNVNMSPDWPTVGAVVAGLYPLSGGTRVDGVIGIDPAGLQALLTLTGPVRVAGWPVPIGAGNILPVTLHDAYVRYTDEATRTVFLGNVAHAAFTAFSRFRVTDPLRLVDVLGPLLQREDLLIYSTHPADEAYLRQAGASGAMPPVESDSIDLTTQNAAGNKIDYYLHRQLSYEVTLRPQDVVDGAPTAAQADEVLGVTLHNAAPASGLPPGIIGPYLPQFHAGEEVSYVSLYSPLAFEGATLDGGSSLLSSGTELGRHVYSSFVDVASGRTARLVVALQGEIRLLPGGWYELALPHQPVINPDLVHIVVRVAPGWRLTGVRGGTQTGTDEVTAGFVQQTGRTIWVRIAPSGSN